MSSINTKTPTVKAATPDTQVPFVVSLVLERLEQMGLNPKPYSTKSNQSYAVSYRKDNKTRILFWRRGTDCPYEILREAISLTYRSDEAHDILSPLDQVWLSAKSHTERDNADGD